MRGSNFYWDYRNARDKAWQIIFNYDVCALPVSMQVLCSRMGIRLFSYSSGINLIRKYKLEKYTVNDGFSTILQNNYVIFYNESVPSGRRRFTIAHEMGHIVLGHIEKSRSAMLRAPATHWNKGEKGEPDPLETAANIFASRLLAPACVLWKLDIHTANEISELCGLSKQAAQIRAKRMEYLYRKNKFEQSLLERQALKQFSEFIDKYAAHDSLPMCF